MKSLFLILSLFISFYAHAADKPVSFDNLVNQEKQAEGLSQNYDKLIFVNNCHLPVYIYLGWRDLDGEWKADGPWLLSPGQGGYLADTRNSYYYFSAVATDDSIVWEGDTSVELPNGKVVKMIEKRITSDEFGTWTQELTCY